MSVPDAKALSPAPVRISALSERSLAAPVQISASRRYMLNVSAFLACGRLKVIRPMPSLTSYSRSASRGAVSFILLQTRLDVGIFAGSAQFINEKTGFDNKTSIYFTSMGHFLN